MKIGAVQAIYGTILLTGAVTVISVIFGLQRLRGKAIVSQIDNIDILSHTFEQHITQTADSVSAVILNSNSLFTPRNIHKHGRSLLTNAPYLRSLYVCDMAGNVISGTEEFTGILPADLNSFLPVPFSDSSILRFGLPMKGRDLADSSALSGQETGNPELSFFPVIKKISAEGREFYALAVFNPDYFDNFYTQRIPDSGTSVTILRYDSRILFTNDTEFRTGGLLKDFAEINTEGEKLHISGNYNDLYIYSWRASAVYPVSVLVKRDIKTAMQTWEEERLNVLWIIILLTGITLVFAVILLLRIASHQEAQRIMMEKQNAQALLSEEHRRKSLLQLLINLAHQWRQPLNTVGLLIQKMQIEHEEGVLTQESLNASSETILKEIRDLSSTISKFTEIYEKSDDQYHSSPAEILRKAESLLSREAAAVPVKINKNFQENEIVPVAANHLLDIFFQLLENAYWIAGSKKTVNPEVSFRSEHTAGRWTLYAEDNLGGIDPEILSGLFSPYTTSRFRTRNRGMGLFRVNQIVSEIYQGTASAENTGYGARFRFTFPDKQ